MPAPPDVLTKTAEELGVVVIGRNEGERLRRCLSALLRSCATIVYVDSGSSDDSVNFARSNGVEVVELDMSSPFTAGRARNEGFARLDELCPRVEFVQFLDGDCELNAEWLSCAVTALKSRNDVAIVCGALLEREPERSIYNRICAIEWNGPVGEVATCGGNFVIRAEAFRKVSGFNPTV